MIRFESLTKRYGTLTAVRELWLDVPRGEIFALLGPNGAGKTTALRCLAALLRPSDGTASVDRLDVRQQPLEARRRLGFLAASMGLYERLTPPELLRYFGRLHELDGDALEARIEQLLRRFDIADFAHRYCGRLSTGQRQRVSIARAVLHDPPALVLDEPTFGLDVISGEAIYAFMREERDRGKAILFSTHQLSEVELLADRVGIIRGGELVAVGTLTQILEQAGEPNLTRAFLRLVGGGEAA